MCCRASATARMRESGTSAPPPYLSRPVCVAQSRSLRSRCVCSPARTHGRVQGHRFCPGARRRACHRLSTRVLCLTNDSSLVIVEVGLCRTRSTRARTPGGEGLQLGPPTFGVSRHLPGACRQFCVVCALHFVGLSHAIVPLPRVSRAGCRVRGIETVAVPPSDAPLRPYARTAFHTHTMHVQPSILKILTGLQQRRPGVEWR